MDLDRVFFVVTAIAGVKESLNWSFPIVALGLILCAYDFNWKFQIHYCFIHHNDVNAVSIDTCIAWQWCVRNFYNKNNLFVCLQEVTSLLCLLSITRCGPQMIKYFSQRHKLHRLGDGLYALIFSNFFSKLFESLCHSGSFTFHACLLRSGLDLSFEVLKDAS